MIHLEYEPQPRQALLNGTRARQILYGGAAGGGKSYSLRWDAIDFCLNCPGLNAVLFRRTLPQLETNHVVEVRRSLPQEVGRYNETKKRFEFVNGSLLIFKHLEHEKDVDDIQGWEIHWCGVDEAGQFTPYQLDYMYSRVRLGGYEKRLNDLARDNPVLKEYADRLPRFALSANPGGVSHHFLKERFIDPAPPETYFYDKTRRDPNQPDYPGPLTVFIPATMQDNYYLDVTYGAQFAGLPEWQQRQLRDGDWNVVPGAFFECWGPQNVIRPFKVPQHWTRFRSWDWGFATPFCVLEWAVSDGSEITDITGRTVQYPEGAIILTWEWYGSSGGNKGLRMPADIVANQTVAQRGEVKYEVADPSMWRTDSGISAAERAYKGGAKLIKGDNKDRTMGWQEMYARIDQRLLLSFDTNHNFNRIIPTLECDPHKPEDVLKEGEDHAGDSARYAVMSRPPVSRKSLPPADPLKTIGKALTFNDIMRRNESRYRRDRIWN